MRVGRDAAVFAGAALLGAALAALVVLRPGDVQRLANWLSPVPPPPFAALGGPVAPLEAEFAALLAQVPDGLGAPPPAGDAARAFVTATLPWPAEEAPRDSSQAAVPLATVVSADAGRLVAVLSAWSALDTFVPSTYAAEVDGAEMLRAMVPRGEPDLRRLCDGLAALSREPSRPALDRALAAYALGEIADLPLGLSLSLPSEDDAAARPTEEIAAAWSAVRDLRGSAAFEARLRLATRAGPAADTWLRRHIGPGAVVSALQRRPLAVLRALAGDASTPAEMLARMEQEPTLRLPLHHLLTLEGAAGDAPAPRVTASSDGAGVVVAWRRALRLAEVPFVVRVARLERRPSGLRIRDEERSVLRESSPTRFSWSEDVDARAAAGASWQPPGSLGRWFARTRIATELTLRLMWTDDGARIVSDELSAYVRDARGESSRRSSGMSWPADMPQAITALEGAPEPQTRLVLLVLAEPGQGADEAAPFDLVDWRRAAAAAGAAADAACADSPPCRAQRRERLLHAAGAQALLRAPADTVGAVRPSCCSSPR